MKVAVPGIAFAALKDSGLPSESPDLWTRVLTYSVTMSKGRGVSVHLDMDDADLLVIRDTLESLRRKLVAQPYPVRGVEGNITMQSIGIAVSRLDTILGRRHDPTAAQAD